MYALLVKMYRLMPRSISRVTLLAKYMNLSMLCELLGQFRMHLVTRIVEKRLFENVSLAKLLSRSSCSAYENQIEIERCLARRAPSIRIEPIIIIGIDLYADVYQKFTRCFSSETKLLFCRGLYSLGTSRKKMFPIRQALYLVYVRTQQVKLGSTRNWLNLRQTLDNVPLLGNIFIVNLHYVQ